MKCLVTGKNSDSYLSEEGKRMVDLEQLCNEVIYYKGGNPIWDDIINTLYKPEFFAREVVKKL